MSDLTWPYDGDLEASDPEELIEGYKAPTFLPKLLDDADTRRDDR